MFSVLELEQYEVKLHSPFLTALLDHKRPNEAERSNLRAFLESVAGVRNFEPRGVRVEREKWNIDILVTNAEGQAMIIENKIGARDQRRQLWRYYQTLAHQGFADNAIRTCYLTLNGDTPSEQVVSDIPPERITSIGYGDSVF